MNQTKLWNKNFLLTFVSNIFYALVFFTLMATIAEYAIEKYETTEAIAGLCVSIFVIGSLVARIISGFFLDIVGRKKLLIFGGLLSVAGSLLYFIPMGLVGFLAVRTINGMAWGVVCNLLNAVVIDFVPPGRLGEGIGYYTMGNPVSSGVGPLIGIFLVSRLGTTAEFFFIFAVCIIPMALMPLIGVQEHKVVTADKEKQLLRFPKFNEMFEKRSIPISAIAMLTTICFSAIPAFMQLYTVERGVGWVAPFYFIAYSAVVILIRPLSGKILDRDGDNPLIIPTLILFGVGIFVLSLANAAAWFFVVAVICAVGYGSFFSAFQAMAVKVAPPERSGLAITTVYIFADFGMGIGPFIWGAVVRHAGYSHMFMMEAAVVLVTLILYYIVHGRHPSAKRRV
jgi:MFS family permease